MTTSFPPFSQICTLDLDGSDGRFKTGHCNFVSNIMSKRKHQSQAGHAVRVAMLLRRVV